MLCRLRLSETLWTSSGVFTLLFGCIVFKCLLIDGKLVQKTVNLLLQLTNFSVLFNSILSKPLIFRNNIAFVISYFIEAVYLILQIQHLFILDGNIFLMLQFQIPYTLLQCSSFLFKYVNFLLEDVNANLILGFQGEFLCLRYKFYLVYVGLPLFMKGVQLLLSMVQECLQIDLSLEALLSEFKELFLEFLELLLSLWGVEVLLFKLLLHVFEVLHAWRPYPLEFGLQIFILRNQRLVFFYQSMKLRFHHSVWISKVMRKREESWSLHWGHWLFRTFLDFTIQLLDTLFLLFQFPGQPFFFCFKIKLLASEDVFTFHFDFPDLALDSLLTLLRARCPFFIK